jgi:hypothetical protein
MKNDSFLCRSSFVTPESEPNIFGRKGRLVCPQNLHLCSLLPGLEAESRAFGPKSTTERVIGSQLMKWRCHLPSRWKHQDSAHKFLKGN